MFNITCSISNLISCREYILRGKKGKIVSPSQLDSTWLRQPKNLEVKKKTTKALSTDETKTKSKKKENKAPAKKKAKKVSKK